MSECFVGEIKLWACSRIPSGFVPCDGRSLPIAGNETLYSLLGVTYGGDGTTNFCVPDLRGRIPVSQGKAPDQPTTYSLGQPFGQERVALSQNELPAHTHNFNVGAIAATATAPASTETLAAVEPNVLYVNESQAGNALIMKADALAPAGGNSAHNNIQPSLVLNYIIATVGYYPTQG